MSFQSSPRPVSSPWGAVQHAREYAPGIWSVSTASHGGFHLSAERLAAMPDYMRADGGWFEEDCAWCLVAMCFPAAFLFTFDRRDGTRQTHYHYAKEIARHWLADEYERFFGVQLTPEESRQRRA